MKGLSGNGIPEGMQRLDDQLHQAQQAFNRQQQDPQEALNQVERLRNQMEALARGMSDAAARNGQQGQRGQQPGQQGQGQPDSNKQQPGQQPQMGQLSRNGQPGNGQPGQGKPAGQANGQGANAGGPNGGQMAARAAAPWPAVTAPSIASGMAAIPVATWAPGRETQQVPSSPQEIQRAYEDAMRQLNALRQSFQGQPEPLADLQELIKEMQRLDPSRFPGNPAMLEELHDQVLTSVDKLELRLRRQADDERRRCRPDSQRRFTTRTGGISGFGGGLFPALEQESAAGFAAESVSAK